MLSQQLKIYSRENVLAYTNIRKFETKIGEVIQTLANTENAEQSIQQSSAKFVIVGVPEDIGIKADYAKGTTISAWTAFLQSFLNLQSNDFFDGSNVLLLGHLNFAGVAEVIESNAGNAEERIIAYRHSVNRIDDEVETIVKLITAANKIPVVISGGHNNAYGCIKGAAKGWHKVGATPIAQINVINLDANSGYKPLEGRHSGNAFRYADEDGYLQKYCVIGLQESELPQNCWLDIVNNPFFDFITYEDIFISRKQSFTEAVRHAAGFTSDTICGVEMDLDNIRVASATGIPLAQARQFLHMAATEVNPAYLHIAEPFSRQADTYNTDYYGQIISQLVSDFIKGIQ